MKNFKSLSVKVALSIFLSLSISCTKDSGNPTPDEPQVVKKLKSILVDSGTHGVLNLEYNGENLFKSTFENFVYEDITVNTYFYDSNNNVISISGIRTSTDYPTYEYTIFYTYDSDGKVLTRAFNGSEDIITYSYEDSRILEKKPSEFNSDSYLTVSNGNLEIIESSNYITEYTHDDKPNAYGKIIPNIITRWIFDDYQTDYPMINVNNLVRWDWYSIIDGIKTEEGYAEFLYQYDSDGYPISCQKTEHFSTSETIQSYDYVYEP